MPNSVILVSSDRNFSTIRMACHTRFNVVADARLSARGIGVLLGPGAPFEDLPHHDPRAIASHPEYPCSPEGNLAAERRRFASRLSVQDIRALMIGLPFF